MNLKQMAGWGKSSVPENAEPEAQPAGRCMSLLAEGMVLNTLQVVPAIYQNFREKVSSLAQQMPDRLPDADKLAVIQKVIKECEHYRTISEHELRDRLAGWRTLASRLLVDLLPRMGIDPAAGEASSLVKRVASLMTGAETHGFLVELTDFFRLASADGKASRASQLREADRSTANDNAAGLRGGGAAVEHVRKMMERDISGFVVLFHLNCLDMIGERFGMEAVQDSLMAVSAFLTHSLRSDDAVYHWSDSSLLAVLQTPVSVPILTAAMRRIVDNNRDITIQIGGRTVMLRIPLEFEITPINNLRSAEEMNKLSTPGAAKW